MCFEKMFKLIQNKLSLFVQGINIILIKNVNNLAFLEFETAPEASSACSERLFSGGKIIFETKRNRLGDANFEKLLLLSVNKDL